MAYYQGKLYNKRSKLTARRQEDEVCVCLRGAHSSFKEGILTVCLESPGRWQLSLEAQPTEVIIGLWRSLQFVQAVKLPALTFRSSTGQGGYADRCGARRPRTQASAAKLLMPNVGSRP